jgi:hypothetical protein
MPVHPPTHTPAPLRCVVRPTITRKKMARVSDTLLKSGNAREEDMRAVYAIAMWREPRYHTMVGSRARVWDQHGT